MQSQYNDLQWAAESIILKEKQKCRSLDDRRAKNCCISVIHTISTGVCQQFDFFAFLCPYSLCLKQPFNPPVEWRLDNNNLWVTVWPKFYQLGTSSTHQGQLAVFFQTLGVWGPLLPVLGRYTNSGDDVILWTPQKMNKPSGTVAQVSSRGHIFTNWQMPLPEVPWLWPCPPPPWEWPWPANIKRPRTLTTRPRTPTMRIIWRLINNFRA